MIDRGGSGGRTNKIKSRLSIVDRGGSWCWTHPCQSCSICSGLCCPGTCQSCPGHPQLPAGGPQLHCQWPWEIGSTEERTIVVDAYIINK